MRLGAHLKEANRLPEGLGNKWYAGPPEEEAHESVAGCAKSEQFVRHHDTTMTLFTKCYPPPLGTRINNTVPALKTTTVNRPVPALKNNAHLGANKKYNRPVPALKKHNHPVPSRLEKKIQPPRPASEKIQPPRPASEKKKNRPVPLREKKRPPRPASEKKNNRPVPPRKKKKTVPSRQEFCLEKYRPAKNFHPYILPVPRPRRNEKGGSTVNFPPVPSR